MTIASQNNEGVYLRSFLAPLAPWLDREDVTDILINRSGEVWFETASSGFSRSEVPVLTDIALQR